MKPNKPISLARILLSLTFFSAVCSLFSQVALPGSSSSSANLDTQFTAQITHEQATLNRAPAERARGYAHRPSEDAKEMENAKARGQINYAWLAGQQKAPETTEEAQPQARGPLEKDPKTGRNLNNPERIKEGFPVFDALYDDFGCSAGQLWDSGAQKCEWMKQLPYSSTMTIKDLEPYFKVGRPVIYRADTAPLKDWPARTKWTPEYFVQGYGDETVNVQAGRSRRKDFETAQHLLRKDMKLSEYLGKVMKNEVQNDVYMTSNNNFFHRKSMQPLMADMEPLFPGLMYKDPQQTHFWLGPAKTYTPLHFDPISLFHTQVKGAKTWVMIAPEWRPYMCNHYAVYTPVDYENPDTSSSRNGCPTYAEVMPYIIKQTVQEGETLFVPSGWWHVVYSEDTPTISVSFTSWVSQLSRYDRLLREKYPMKSAANRNSHAKEPAAQQQDDNRPSSPGSQTPAAFDLAEWTRDIAQMHNSDGLKYASRGAWPKAFFQDKQAEYGELQSALSEIGMKSAMQMQMGLWLVLHAECSAVEFDWKAWITENVARNSPMHTIWSVLGSEMPTTSMEKIARAFNKCADDKAIWEKVRVQNVALQNDASILKRIREVQRGATQNPAVWKKARQGKGWKPPNRRNLQAPQAWADQHSEEYGTSLEVVSPSDPIANVIHNFLRPGEAAELMRLASGHFMNSTVVGEESRKDKNNKRSSQGAWVPPRDPTVLKIIERAAAMVGLPKERAEGINVLKYEQGGEYLPHLDGCDSRSPNGSIDESCIRFLGGTGDRIITVIMMLEPATKGGAFAFSRKTRETRHGNGRCARNWSVQMQQDDALTFFIYHPEHTHPEGKIDQMAEHTGCPVEGGRKLVATIWFRGS